MLRVGVMLCGIALLGGLGSAAGQEDEDSYERSLDPRNPQYTFDACTACRAALDAVTRQMKKPSRAPRSEGRAEEIMESGLCDLAIGPTRSKCDAFLESHEEALIGYIRSGEPDADAVKARLCGGWCDSGEL
eukprot:Hpha_TRINITY_DN26199_c0_g1::TRINITY_DN26199_c0_g1_i1::g.155463::m.155463